MQIEVFETIQAPPAKVWNIITNIENADVHISGIEKIEILEKPASGLIGLKWRETRTLFGKSASEDMWITRCEASDFYETRAESHGSVYISRLSVKETTDGSQLTMRFSASPQSIIAKILSVICAPLFKGATIRALQQDLADVKLAAEKSG